MQNLLKASLFAIPLLFAAPAAAQSSAFGVNALPDASLAKITGTYLPSGYARNARTIVSENARIAFDSTGSISRVIFDNWFAREGADLLAASILDRPLPLN